MKKFLVNTLKVICVIYIIVCGLLYFFQEKMIFFPEQLDKNFKFSFAEKYEELNVKTQDGTVINLVLFKADSSKGVIFYLHGNGGSVRTWGKVAKTYTSLGYDIVITDYRGYGKSEGAITGQEQIYSDLQTVYDELKKRYKEDRIVVLGYSIGTGPAAWVASVNHPRKLILQAPYYSLTDMMQHTYPIVPTFLLKYKFPTSQYVTQCKMPVVLFHGNKDEVIYYHSSVKLREKMKPGDTLITLDGQGHNGITDNEEYVKVLPDVLK